MLRFISRTCKGKFCEQKTKETGTYKPNGNNKRYYLQKVIHKILTGKYTKPSRITIYSTKIHIMSKDITKYGIIQQRGYFGKFGGIIPKLFMGRTNHCISTPK